MAHTWGAWFASVLNRMFSWLPFPDEWKFEGRVRVVANIALKGDWETVTIEAGKTWVCPEGQYEIYVLTNQELMINDIEERWAFSNFTCWLPALIFIDATGNSLISASPRGWSFSKGETIKTTTDSEFRVRFRRVA